ncbi:MAG: amylo-alpha-1,6-glucosidase [Spirochaetales bacterium]|nr:amylo-alpha-1,6-glucosidase [Spirochaetales bacterium]
MNKFSQINKMLVEEGCRYEWLETNGAGAFASSSIIECHSRKYHGMLVTPLDGKEGRYHILSSIEASVKADPDFNLATNNYPKTVFPNGYTDIESFSTLPVPTWIYKKGEERIKKEIFMSKGEKAVYVVFTQMSGKEVELDLKFLFTYRNADTETHQNYMLNTGSDAFDKGFSINPYHDMPEASISFSGEWSRLEDWYWDYSVEYHIERDRGLEFSEDRFVPGVVTIVLEKNIPFIIRVGVESDVPKADNLSEIYNSHLKSCSSKSKKIKSDKDFLKYYAAAFLVKNSKGQKSVNAGFPWFGEWGRDTMIALPGLTFCIGDTAWAVSVLTDYAEMIKDGLLPNTLGESQGFTSYNSLDAGLLYCRTVLKLLETGFGEKKTELQKIKQTLLPAVESIVTAFIEGRVPNAKLNKDCLIEAGSPDTQLTWMDATAYGKPVTPRCGLAVDINALWFDSLNVYKSLLEMGEAEIPNDLIKLIKKVQSSFKKTFWIADKGFLTDTVFNGKQDGQLRPNMLFAASASKGLLAKRERASIVKAAKEQLLTPMGLRTLSPEDSSFEPYYNGNPDERDSKYHQGTVWPWLIGIMVESSLLSASNLDKERDFWTKYLDNLLENHLYQQGIGFVSEVFDGSNPSWGKGCFAQAWSTGEILRSYSLLENKV